MIDMHRGEATTAPDIWLSMREKSVVHAFIPSGEQVRAWYLEGNVTKCICRGCVGSQIFCVPGPGRFAAPA